MFRWFAFAWALGATILMAVSGATLLGFLAGPHKDAGVVLWLALFAGLPAWLIVLALTATRWHESSRKLVAIQNAPAICAMLIFAIVFLSGF